MIVMVTGSKEYTDRETVETWVESLAPGTKLISAGSNTGPDAWARKRARTRGDMPVEIIKALWQGPLDHDSGKIRNIKMVTALVEDDDPDKLCVAFLARNPKTGGWSENGKHALTVAREHGITVKVRPLGEGWADPEDVPKLPRPATEAYRPPAATSFDLCGDDPADWWEDIR